MYLKRHGFQVPTPGRLDPLVAASAALSRGGHHEVFVYVVVGCVCDDRGMPNTVQQE